jgi:hypothetical protein
MAAAAAAEASKVVLQGATYLYNASKAYLEQNSPQYQAPAAPSATQPDTVTHQPTAQPDLSSQAK